MAREKNKTYFYSYKDITLAGNLCMENYNLIDGVGQENIKKVLVAYTHALKTIRRHRREKKAKK
jgi:hypothetical protein